MKGPSTVYQTKSGVFVRNDEGIGLLAFSPFTGLCYAVAPEHATRVLCWLNGQPILNISDSFRSTLGIGWDKPLNQADHKMPHLLPNIEAWSNMPTLSNPIAINWFITGRCPLKCKYCYAEELMRNDALEPSKDDIQRIASSILSLHPLFVVLTGGDPLFSPNLELAAEALSGKAGLVLDTSGYTLRKGHLALFKKHLISVRISLDSERPQVNQFQRPLYPDYTTFTKSGVTTLDAALNALCGCLAADIPVTVQTVATKRTVNDLPHLGNKLYKLGVHSWRVLRVVPSKASEEGYRILEKETPQRRLRVKDKAYPFVFERLLQLHRTKWRDSMALQVTENEQPNSVILVAPDGKYYTESKLKLEKVSLDPERPKNPRLESIVSQVSMQAHADRYLNIMSKLRRE